jgi:hypothetical protein
MKTYLWSWHVLMIGLVLGLGAACAPAPTGSAPAAEEAVEQPTEPAPAEEAAGAEPEQVPTLDELPPPVTCAPENPLLTPVDGYDSPTLDDVYQEYQGDADDSNEAQPIYVVKATYTNPETGQRFLFTINSEKPEQLQRFVEEIRVCFEVIDTGIPAPTADQEDSTQESDIKVAIDFLHENPENILFDTPILESETTSENLVVVHYVIDPTIDSDRTDDFRAKCAYSAYVAVEVRANRAIGSLYIRGGWWDDTSEAVAGAPSDRAEHYNGQSRTTYDARVKGTGGTVYTVFGTWTEAGWAISSNVC